MLPLAAAFGAETYLLDLFMRVMIFAIAALGLDLLVGYGALVSFGHAAFIGIGAYAVAILASHGINEALISLPVALIAATAFAYLTGTICLRTRGVYFIMITLAFGQMAYFLASSLAPYGGDDGLTMHARSTLFGLSPFKNERLFYYIVLACLVGCYCLCRALVVSRFGRVFRGARENATRMATLGFDIYRYQLDRLCDLRRARRAGRFPARQRHRFRQPRLHVVAALGRTDHHDHLSAGSARCTAPSSARWPTRCWANSCPA